MQMRQRLLTKPIEWELCQLSIVVKVGCHDREKFLQDLDLPHQWPELQTFDQQPERRLQMVSGSDPS